MDDTRISNLKYAEALERTRPFHMLQPHTRIFLYGNPGSGRMWCILYGENLQDGVAGFGETPDKASYDFDKNWLKVPVHKKET
jgi:hypothetical protein